MKKILVIIACAFLLASPAFGWFIWEDDYDKCYIAGGVPGQHLEPVSIDEHPDSELVSLPLSIRVQTESRFYDIQVVRLQWRLESEPGVENWVDAEISYSNTSQNFEFAWNNFHFGRSPDNTVRPFDHVEPGAVVLVRLYIANLTDGYQNASLDVDTDSSGQNGWEAPWVVRFPTRDDDIRMGW